MLLKPDELQRRLRHAQAHPDGQRACLVSAKRFAINQKRRIVRNMVVGGAALCVSGNHDIKLMRKLSGKSVQITYGLDRSLAEVEALPPEVRDRFVKEGVTFFDDLVGHYVLDDGRLVVAHAGMKQQMQGRGSGKVRDFALHGEMTGKTDEFGLPVRHNWVAEYSGLAMVVYDLPEVLPLG